MGDASNTKNSGTFGATGVVVRIGGARRGEGEGANATAGPRASWKNAAGVTAGMEELTMHLATAPRDRAAARLAEVEARAAEARARRTNAVIALEVLVAGAAPLGAAGRVAPAWAESKAPEPRAPAADGVVKVWPRPLSKKAQDAAEAVSATADKPNVLEFILRRAIALRRIIARPCLPS